MYKVFVNDFPIILGVQSVSDKDVECFSLKGLDIDRVVSGIQEKQWKQVYIWHDNPEVLLQKFKKKMEVVVAAGGLVKNKKGDILFIKRNGKWDLPKGRVEPDEKIETAALRETEEETGVQGLSIVKPLQITYHIFSRNNKLKLKETFWFEMITDYKGKLTPEKKEGIKKAEWRKQKKWKKTLKKSYANIRELF